MPAKRKVSVRYVRARVTPSKRKPKINGEILLRQPKGLTPLALYIEENRDTGIPVTELIEQFQEYDCEHQRSYLLALTAEKFHFTCDDCGMVEVRYKPGVQNG